MKNYIIAAVAIILAAVFSYASADSKIYISQVQITGGNLHSSDDFVELFNPNPTAFNLNGYWLVTRTSASSTNDSLKSWASDTSIPAYSYFLWANSGFASLVPQADVTTSYSISGSDFGVGVVQKSDGRVLDGIAWGAGTDNGLRVVSDRGPGAGQSLVRLDLFSDISAFTIASSSPHNTVSTPVTPPIDLSPVATSTPDATTVPDSIIYSTDIKISEIVPNPIGSDDGNEAVELVNTGTSTVDVTGWLIDDFSDHGVKTGAYQLPTTTIAVGQFLAIVIPTGHFSLNNTGDTVDLYYADKALADSVTYSSSAAESYGYQNVNGSWVWGPATLGAVNAAPVSLAAGGGGSGASALASINPPVVNYIHISEVLPKSSSTSTRPWVELYNAGTSKINLSGWKLDNLSGSNLPSDRAFTLDSSVSINPKSYVVVTIPTGSFEFNNSGDGVRLFKVGGQLLERVDFTDAPAGQSYNLSTSGNWLYGRPSPGAVNVTDAPFADVIISEILANPGGDDEEFVELENLSTTSAVNLKGFKLSVGDREKILNEAVVATSSFYTMFEDDLPVKLRNSGQTITLIDNFDRLLQSVTYPKAAKGQAYVWAGDGYVWTEQLTPNESNELVLGATTAELGTTSSLNKNQAVTTLAKKTSSATDRQTISELEQQVEDLSGQVQDLRQQVELAGGPDSTKITPVTSVGVGPSPSTSRDLVSNMALVMSALALLVVVVKFLI